MYVCKVHVLYIHYLWLPLLLPSGAAGVRMRRTFGRSLTTLSRTSWPRSTSQSGLLPSSCSLCLECSWCVDQHSNGSMHAYVHTVGPIFGLLLYMFMRGRHEFVTYIPVHVATCTCTCKQCTAFTSTVQYSAGALVQQSQQWAEPEAHVPGTPGGDSGTAAQGRHRCPRSGPPGAYRHPGTGARSLTLVIFALSLWRFTISPRFSFILHFSGAQSLELRWWL